MSYSYAKLGSNCKPTTHALTSNAKYILPNDPVYYKRFTPMMYYPGRENMYGLDSDKLFGARTEPEHLKAFEVKETSNNCSSCKTQP